MGISLCLSSFVLVSDSHSPPVLASLQWETRRAPENPPGALTIPYEQAR